jgi:hypothetical protein
VNDMQQLVSKIPNWQNQVDTYIAARVAMDAEHKALYRRILKSPSLSLEYDFNRPPAVASSTSSSNSTSAAVSSPDLSSVGLIYVASLFDSDYTLNANANFFNSTGPTMRGNFRDLQFAAKIDIPVGKLPSFVAKGTLTFSGLYEYLYQRPLGITLTINDQAVNQPGNIGLFQAKYTIPIGDSGLQFPISFTASNRSRLTQQGPHQLRIPCGEKQRRECAVRMSNHDHFPKAQRTYKLCEVVRIYYRRVAGPGRIRIGMVVPSAIRDRAIGLGKRPDLISPVTTVAQRSMNKDCGHACALIHVVQCDAVSDAGRMDPRFLARPTVHEVCTNGVFSVHWG